MTMHRINRTIATTILAAAVGGGTYAFLGSPLVPTVQAKWAEHPRLERAYRQLREAQFYLEKAPHDFHGHRTDAVHAIEAARHWLGICADDLNAPSGIASRGLEEREHEPLHKAVEHLRDAKEYLKTAHGEFHGKREESIRALDEAIHQLRLCLGEHE